MDDLLTRDEYGAIARELSLPVNAFIHGRFTPAHGGGTFETVNPATGKVLAEVASCDAEDVDRAVVKAREAFERGAWSKMHPSERKHVLIQLVKLLKRNRYELAVMESLESGKTIRDCALIDLPETLNCLEWHAEATDKIYGQVSPSGDDALGMIVREPLGVVACVIPWNFPIMLMAWKIGPALAAGNSVIVKPAEQTNTTALRVAELALEAGIPEGVLSVVTGPGETTGKAIGLHPGIRMVSFTGSTEVGRLFLEYAAKSNLKRIVLECGGKNPCLVLDDAENLDSVAAHVTQSVLWNMGQNCSSNSRLIVHRKIKDALVEKVMDRFREWRIGDPLDPQNHLGAMTTPEQYEKVLGYIETGKKEGAELLVGGGAIENGGGYFIAPTIFDGVVPEMTIARDEIFGPVLSVIAVGDAAEAVEIANDTAYGLQASVFTSNVKRAHALARALQAGTVTVNCYGEGDITTPFGGYKLSGFGGRDNSLLAHDQYTETKTIWIDLSDDPIGEQID
ncbi:MAG: aldehyde dehydrogenase [Rhodospirillales bacterium]|jgi:gamma-glutamyl-gamma-aminobutyraldehyde dehydrogenase|nr:aldehyde dehydrogenase [Rhodospirillales bacterium]